MKASELKEMIQKIVAEEIRRQLPQVMSEMLVRKIVSETMQAVPQVVQRPHVNEARVPAPARVAPAAPKRYAPGSIREALMADFDLEGNDEPPPPRRQASPKQTQAAILEQQRREAIQSSPFAALIEDVEEAVEVGQEHMATREGDEPTDDIIQMVAKRKNKLLEIAGVRNDGTMINERAPVAETEAMAQRRLERLRQSLEVKVG
jgi:hypothetical protein